MQYSGIVEDPRSKKEKAKDWKAEELAGSLVVNWKEKKKWKTYTERNQKSTNSCVAQSLSKMLEVLNKIEENKTVVFSATPIYEKRANKPSEGMWLQNALQIAKDHGTTTENRIKSQMLKSDSEMTKEFLKWSPEDEEIAKIYGVEAYAEVQIDMDVIAGHIEAGRPVLLFIYADINEYTEFPTIKNSSLLRENAPIRHAITAVDYGLIKGKKYLKIEDSAHFKNVSERYFDEAFLSRVYGCAVLFDRDNSVLPDWKKMKYTFTKPLALGEKGKDIVALQDILKLEGFFPVATESTGYYGEITRQAVEKFQQYYQVASLMELVFVKGKRVGEKTLAKLNELY